MTIRNFQPGDEAAQVKIYNEAAAGLPKFKPATLDEVRRRCAAAEFDPAMRFFAVDQGTAAGYASFHANGRVSFPWYLPGREALAEPLFEAVLQAMRSRGMKQAFAAYRSDWRGQCDFFAGHGFRFAREMVNYVIDLADAPTSTPPPAYTITAFHPQDVEDTLALAPRALRVSSVAVLEQQLLHNPYFGADALFALRDENKGKPSAVGILIENKAYADPRLVDAAMPCFRLGAFGTETMQTKRINGLFSVLVPEARADGSEALALLGYATRRLRESKIQTVAAQVPSDMPGLLCFYEHYFKRQGSFPVYERAL